ncbi:MAG TPA: LamG domain-containing protein [Solirubrobacteraceae bacterium]
MFKVGVGRRGANVVRGGLVAALATGGLALGASSATAATTVGQPVTPNVLGQCLPGTETDVQTAVSSGTSYAVPADGTLTSFSTEAWAPLGNDATVQLAVFRADPATPGNYIVVGVSNEALTLGNIAPAAPIVTPITPIAVKAGDLLGLVNHTAAVDRCAKLTLSSTDDIALALDTSGGPAPAPGDSITLSPPPFSLHFRLSIAANLVPTCDTTLVPVGCWHFDETSGTTVADSSPFANNGTLYNGSVAGGAGGPVLGGPGVRNTSISMDGVNDAVRVPDSASLDVADTFSLEGWIKRTSDAKSQELFNKGGNGFQLSVMNAANGDQVWLRKANVTTIARSAVGVPADGRFHHIVVTRNGAGAGNTTIYIDGVASTVLLAPTQVIANTAFPMTFGGVGGQASFDEFAVYHSVLTQAQVSDLYAAGAVPVPPPI